MFSLSERILLILFFCLLMEEYYLLLRKHIEEISSLTDEEWDFIAQHFTYKKLKKHQFLVQKDELVSCEY